jgi:uncharacterized protein YcgI (DUF1989 family)
MVHQERKSRLIQSYNVVPVTGLLYLKHSQSLSKQAGRDRLLIVWQMMGDPVKIMNCGIN